MIYGEQEKAFLRLQQHIIQKSKDESIFAWATEFPGNTKTYSGLFAPSPLAYASCSDIVQTQESHGFSENNGELSMQLRLFPHSSETFGAILNCTDRAYPHNKIFILVGRTSTKDEYVRVADTKHVGRRLIDSGRWALLKERQIHVLENPIESPVNIFYGFWLQTVPPSGHGEFKTTILSNSHTPESDRICPPQYNHQIAGIVKIEPSKSAGFFEPSKNRWISFSFDHEFNPVIWLIRRDNNQQELPQEMFREAVASGSQSLAHQQVMETFKPKTREGHFKRIDRRTGPRGQLIKAIDLEIFIQLTSTDSGGQAMSPMKIWIVKISTVREDPLQKYLRLGPNHSKKRRIMVFLYHLYSRDWWNTRCWTSCCETLS